MQKLKPCPHCALDVKFTHMDFSVARIECEHCNVALMINYKSGRENTKQIHERVEEAIERWNRRLSE